MWHRKMEEKERLKDSEPLLNQIIRCFKGREETVGTMEHNYSAEMGVQTENEMYQEQICMDDSSVLEENSPDERTSKELPNQYLLVNRQEEQIGGNALNEVSNHSFKKGQDYTWDMKVLLSPKEGVLVNNISNEVLSSCHPKERGTELPDISGMNPRDCENVNKSSSNQTQSRIIEDYADAHQHGGREAKLCTTAAESKMGEDFCLLGPKQNFETERLTHYMKNPCCPDISVYNSQEEFCQQRDSHASNSDDYYECIEEFLGEGALVNIDSAQTYVDFENGTIKTSVEVSAKDEGMTIKHEVEWVTRFVQSRNSNNISWDVGSLFYPVT